VLCARSFGTKQVKGRATECEFPLRKWVQGTIVSVQIEQIEGEKAGFPAAKEKIVETGSAFAINASNFTIQNHPAFVRDPRERWCKRAERGKLVPVARYQATASVL
jgi:hypothetical protein